MAIFIRNLVVWCIKHTIEVPALIPIRTCKNGNIWKSRKYQNLEKLRNTVKSETMTKLRNFNEN